MKEEGKKTVFEEEKTFGGGGGSYTSDFGLVLDPVTGLVSGSVSRSIDI